MLSKRMSHLALACSFALLSTGLIGASCSKQKKDGTDDPDNGAAAKPKGPPAPQEDLPGVKLDELNADAKAIFFSTIDRAESPCGKAHSLRTSIKTDPDCRRAPFAARWLARWAKVGAGEDELLELYKGRYDQKPVGEIPVVDAPYEGVPNAPVVIVEFFDYTCPHCKKMVPVIEDIAAEFPSDVVIYYKFFPLSGPGHEQGMPCATAAVAAMKQGKFKQMHRKLFALQDKDQSDEAILAAAKEIGLDMPRFEADWKAEATRKRVEADREAGDKLEIGGTPAIYVNGRNYPPIIDFTELKDWVDEEIAVNR
jgi:protein-disulfide isomerase